MCAAVSAAETGASVLLVEQFGELGGAAANMGVSGLCGHTRGVGRVFDEMLAALERADAVAPYHTEQDSRALDNPFVGFVLGEYVLGKGVDVLFHTRAAACNRDRNRIDTVVLSTAAGLEICQPRFIIDATGDADIAYAAGFPTVSGSESGEPPLPMSLYFSMHDTRMEQTPWLPPGCPEFTAETIPMTTLHKRPNGRIDVKMKVIGHSAVNTRELSGAEIEARRHMMGLIYFLQTVGYDGRVWSTYRLSSVSPHIGVREGRRIIGERTPTEKDVRSGRQREDAIGVGTYHIDYHWPEILQRAGTGITDPVPTYHLPLGMLIPRGAVNLLVAGRAASGDQMAMSSFRVMTTAGGMGIAAGMCASLCLRDACAPQEVEIAELRQLLLGNGVVLDCDWHSIYQSQRRRRTAETTGKPLQTAKE
jgi:hypothetical protein